MTQWLKLTVLGVGAYAVFLVSSAPAANVVPWLKTKLDTKVPALNQVQLYDLSGSIWQGRAGVAMIQDVRVEPLEWNFHPLALLKGSVELDVNAKSDKNHLNGTIGRNLTGKIYGKNVDLKVDLHAYPNSARTIKTGVATIEINGQLQGQITQLAITSDGVVQSADGAFKWNAAEILVSQPFVQGPFNIGSYQVKAETKEDAVDVAINDAGGPIKTKGNVKLTPDSAYALMLNLTANPGAPQQIADALQYLGPPEKDGSRVFTLNGRMIAETPIPAGTGNQPPGQTAPK